MHSVGFVIGIPPEQVDGVMETYLHDYEGEDCYYLYYDGCEEFETLEELIRTHPDARNDHTKYGMINPSGRCDYYMVGGRWSGYFLLKNGERADSTTIGEIHFNKMIEEAKEVARKRFDTALDAIKHDKNFKSLKMFQEEYEPMGVGSWAMARDEWAKQRQVKEWNQWRHEHDDKMEYYDFSIDNVLGRYKDYEDRIIYNRMVPVSVVSGDADCPEWEDLPEDVDKGLEWLNKFRELPPDTPVTMVDYHD